MPQSEDFHQVDLDAKPRVKWQKELYDPLQNFFDQIRLTEDQFNDDILKHKMALEKYEEVKQRMLEVDPDFKYEKPEKVKSSE